MRWTGFYLDPQLQGQGLTTAALQTSLLLAERYMHAKSFEGICLADNVGSRRVLEKCGFRLVKEVDMLWKKGKRKRVLVLQRRATAEQ